MRVNDFNFYLKVYMDDKSIDDSANINCLFTEVEVNSGGYLPSHKATRYIQHFQFRSTVQHCDECNCF